MVNVLDKILQFAFNNLFYIIIIGIIGFIIYRFVIVRRRSVKIIDRSEVERIKFIERMKANKTEIPINFYRGSVNYGLITHYKEYDTIKGRPNKKDKNKEEPEMIKISQMVVKPTLFGKFPNPFAKSKCFQIKTSLIKKGTTKWHLPIYQTLDFYFGIYYDDSNEETHTRIIKKDNIIRTDLNNVASIYFVKSQEQSTFDPIHAHKMALREKELEIELAKKKGQQESI